MKNYILLLYLLFSNISFSQVVLRTLSGNVLSTTGGNLLMNRPEYTCGAYTSPGVWRKFMCHNLGADTSLDPHTPVQGIHGNYYQWGASTFIAETQTPTPDAAIVGWNLVLASDGAWGDGVTKSANDPCPDGYRVPTSNEWNGVFGNNTMTKIGSWTNSSTNWTTAVRLGTDLTLPIAGSRYSSDGRLDQRGNLGQYWSSSYPSGTGSARSRYITNSGTGTGTNSKSFGYSVRCISIN